jgi:arylsulfatase A-like enzyme
VPGAQPRRIDTPRSGLDLAPTILELFGVEGSGMDLEGTSLVSEIYGGPAEERDVVLDLPMTSDNDKRRALVHGKWKILATGGAESLRLYDLENDPTEDKPITKGETFDEMARRYKERSRAIKEVPPYACNVGCLNGAYARK